LSGQKPQRDDSCHDEQNSVCGRRVGSRSASDGEGGDHRVGIPSSQEPHAMDKHWPLLQGPVVADRPTGAAPHHRGCGGGYGWRGEGRGGRGSWEARPPFFFVLALPPLSPVSHFEPISGFQIRVFYRYSAKIKKSIGRKTASKKEERKLNPVWGPSCASQESLHLPTNVGPCPRGGWVEGRGIPAR